MLTDSGASVCLFNCKTMFTHVNECHQTLHTASSTDFAPAGIGTAKLDFSMNDGTVHTVVLRDTYYDPNAPNLLSVRQMIECGFGSPDFIELTWKHEARLFDIIDTGKDYIVHPDQWSPSSTSAHSLAQRRPLLQPSPSVLAEKGTVDWMVRRSVYLDYSAFNPHSTCHVDLYTDGKPYPEGNSQCDEFYSIDDPAEDHSWHGRAFWANPPYLNSLIHRMLTKMLKDFWKDPNNTSFTVVLRRSETATWWPLTYFFQEIDNIPAGTTGLFSRPRAGTYDPEALTDAAAEGGADRVFIQGTPFDTVVLYKDATTVPRIDPNQYLHTCLGHYSAEYIIHLIRQGVKFCVNSQRISPRTLRTLLNDCGCAHCHAANTHRPGPFNTFTKAIPQSSTPPLSPTAKPVKWSDAKPFEYIFADTWGPCRPPGFDDSVYIHGFKCPATKKAYTFSSSTKSGQHLHLQQVLDDVYAHGHRPKHIVFRTDNAHEFASEDMRVLFRQYNIKHRPGPPYMHEFQAQIEVLWRDMVKIMTTIMKTYGAPLNVWPLAALHATNTIMNAMPNRHIDMDSPHYRFTGEQFDYAQLRPFWSECYVWQDPDQRQKDGEPIQVSAKLIDNAKRYNYVGNVSNSVYLCFDTAKAKLKQLARPRFLPDYDLMAKHLANTHDALTEPSTDAEPYTRSLYPIRRPQQLVSVTILDSACSKHGNETHAYVQVQCTQQRLPVWTTLKHYLAMDKAHYAELLRYLRHRQKYGDTNVFYPCFAQCAARPVDRQKYHPATVVSVDHTPDAELRYQVYFNSLDGHNTAYCDTDAVVLDTTVKAMLVATRDSDDVTSDFPDDVFMDEPDDIKAKAALLGPNRLHWDAAMHKEMLGVCEEGRAVLTKTFPKNAKVLPTKLVCKKKRKPDGSLDKFKMRCTTRGDLDKSYYSDFDVFAPTANLHTFRLLMTLCILHGCMPYHYDVSQAFLQARVPESEQYYVKFPKEYTHPDGYLGAKMLYAHKFPASAELVEMTGMSDEITVIDGSHPENKAFITLDETVQDLESFMALCAPALGFVPERVVDRKGIRITDARQLWRRNECTLLRKSELHLRSGASPRSPPRITSPEVLSGFALLGLLLILLSAFSSTSGSKSHQPILISPTEEIPASAETSICAAQAQGPPPTAHHTSPSRSSSFDQQGKEASSEEGRLVPPNLPAQGVADEGSGHTNGASPSGASPDAASTAALPQQAAALRVTGSALEASAGAVDPAEIPSGAGAAARSAPEVVEVADLNSDSSGGSGGGGGSSAAQEDAQDDALPDGAGGKEDSKPEAGGVQPPDVPKRRSKAKERGALQETKGKGVAQGTRAERVRVVVEHRRHEWPSDSLFSWSVLGTAMRRIGLREAQPEDPQWELLFCMTEECSGVSSSVWRWPSGFATLRQGQWINHFPGISELSGRERLHRNLRAMVERHGPLFQVMPETYLLPEEAVALKAAAAQLRPPKTRQAGTKEATSNLWLLKNLTFADTRQVVFGQDKIMVQGNTQAPWPEQVKEPFLAQRYVADPYLLHGRKFTVRLYLLVASVYPLRLYVHEEGLVHLAVKEYSSATSALGIPYVHLTNEALAARHDEVQPPTSARKGGKANKGRASGVGGVGRKAAAEARQHKCVLTLRELRSMLLKAGQPVESLWRELESTAVKALLSAEDRLVKHSTRLLQAGGGRAFELLGMDVLIDKQMRPWLLDITDAVPNLQGRGGRHK
ncbi:hypothetical protein CYMTET_55755 [Cymbomonas tetramitiformis]|uniref:Tubulin--tyrosine ligase-like protein 5 n=1 Tax=Cymbomonas tetramitiformis TaxID=36881 RepID=A0AAE0EMN6_9CHLO|nr:hypothetical protein CYMTET_55755 [Cymbomonas tetramitiformis]